MKRIAVQSGDLISVAYDAELCILEVELRNGGVYQFHDVAYEVYISLMNARAKWEYYASQIQDSYFVQCVYPPR